MKSSFTSNSIFINFLLKHDIYEIKFDTKLFLKKKKKSLTQNSIFIKLSSKRVVVSYIVFFFLEY